MTSMELANPRAVAEAAMQRMLGAIRAQRRQLQTLAPGVGGPSSMSVANQIDGLTSAEANLQALVTYARQLEGAVNALGHLEVTISPEQAEADDATVAAVEELAAAVTAGLKALTAEVHAARSDPPAARLLELVLALQAACAPPVTVPAPANAPTYTGLVVSISTQAQAWKDGYTAGYRQACADILARIAARL